MKKTLSNLSKKREIKHIIVTIIILTIVFGFNDNKPTFIFSNWFSNLLTILVLVIITVLVHVVGYKLAGLYFNCKVNLEIWNFRHIVKIPRRLSRKFLIFLNGPIIAILLTLISYGRFYFSAVSTFTVEDKKRIERKYTRVTEHEIALIAVIGLLINLILLFVFKAFGVQKGVLINTCFILFNLIPLSELDGAKIFFGSRTLYIFSLIFFASAIILSYNLGIVAAIILSIIIAMVLTLIYYIKVEYIR